MRISSACVAPVGADAYIRPLAPHQSLPLEGKVSPKATDEVLAPKDINAPKLLQTPFPRRRAARPLAAGGIDRLHTASMVPDGRIPTCARFCHARGLCGLRRAPFLTRQERGERNGRGEDSDFFPPDPLFETAKGAPPLADPPGPERNQTAFGRRIHRTAVFVIVGFPTGACPHPPACAAPRIALTSVRVCRGKILWIKTAHL